MSIEINKILYCRTCQKFTLHEKRSYDICCVVCHSIAVTEFSKEICCEINCNKRAKYQIGDNDKPSHESTFVCGEHKNIFAYDWIGAY